MYVAMLANTDMGVQTASKHCAYMFIYTLQTPWLAQLRGSSLNTTYEQAQSRLLLRKATTNTLRVTRVCVLRIYTVKGTRMDVVVVYIMELPQVEPIIGMCLAPLVEPLLELPKWVLQ
jgi:hypothetical protein